MPGARAAAEQQVERVREHGLAGAGLAGDDVEARRQLEARVLDQQQVLDGELEQHQRPGRDAVASPHGLPAPGTELVAGGGRRRLSARARRTSRAGAGRSSSPSICSERRDAVDEARRDASPGRDLADRASVDRRRRAASRELLWSVSTSSGAITSARALSECGAMNETTMPATPQAITGPPLARL